MSSRVLQLGEQFRLRYAALRLRYAQSERAVALAFFAAGFVFDILSVGRIDAWLTIAQQATYLAVIGFALTQMLLEEGAPPREGWWFRWRSAVVHFLLGALLRWYRRLPGGWALQDSIPIRIVGGREKGFRGYGFKSNHEPGSWKIQVETTDAREIGRIYFELEAVPERPRDFSMEIS